MRASDIPEIIKLSTPEKILLVEDLWDSIPSDESAVPVPQSHMEELDRRLKRYGSPPGNLLSLEELRTRRGKRDGSIFESFAILKISERRVGVTFKIQFSDSPGETFPSSNGFLTDNCRNVI